MWVLGVSYLFFFFVSSVWEALQPRQCRVFWSHLLWFWGSIPWHSFYAWLAIRDLLGTRDWLCRWGGVSSSKCLLCVGGV